MCSQPVNIEQLYSSFKEKYNDVRVGAGASSLIYYNNEWVFVIDPEKRWAFNDDQEATIGFGCVGGTVEPDEKIIDAIYREAKEEITTTIQIQDAQTTYYIDEFGKRRKIDLEDNLRPLIIFEHRFASPDKGASIYLIFLFKSVALQEPKPSSEIPALFFTNLDGFKRFKEPISLSEFHEKYKINTQRPLPTNGTLFPFMSTLMIVNNFGNKLDQFFQV